MKKFLPAMIAFTLVFSLAACGNNKISTPLENNGEVNLAGNLPANKDAPNNEAEASNKAATDKQSNYPTFTGDAIQFFGLGMDEAFDLLGNGALSAMRGYISNDKNGMEVRLTNSVDDIYKYFVHSVQLNEKTDVSFSGNKVGDTLKDLDKRLMDNGAIYSGELKWIVDIDGTTYRIQCATMDDKTISSLEATISEISMAEIKKQNEKLDKNPYAYAADMHEVEARYWE